VDNKKVSIIIPAYNAENWMQRCLKSCLDQTYENIEIIVVDDGSSDGTLNICREMSEKDDRIVVLSGNRGGYHAQGTPAFRKQPEHL
jgi:glycosyltransferase involved in cell wall biosynthesis